MAEWVLVMKKLTLNGYGCAAEVHERRGHFEGCGQWSMFAPEVRMKGRNGFPACPAGVSKGLAGFVLPFSFVTLLLGKPKKSKNKN
jgi:hypothetical protein